MLIHMQDDKGDPLCKTRREDPEISDELLDVTCKKCRESAEVLLKNPGSENKARTKSEFYSYDELKNHFRD